MYRVCKAFTIESGHMLSKHAERCRFPHGHSRRIELVLASPTLDENDMVCDFKWIKLAVGEFLDSFDHALCVNAADPILEKLGSQAERVVVFTEGDPTTERMAERIHAFLRERISSGESVKTADGVVYRVPASVRIERVRVSETPTSWAEYES